MVLFLEISLCGYLGFFFSPPSFSCFSTPFPCHPSNPPHTYIYSYSLGVAPSLPYEPRTPWCPSLLSLGFGSTFLPFLCPPIPMSGPWGISCVLFSLGSPCPHGPDMGHGGGRAEPRYPWAMIPPSGGDHGAPLSVVIISF
jgi:hypothetical protein